MVDNHEFLHATSVALNGKALLLLGPSGSGKSDLALRLIQDKGATLVSDDQVMLKRSGDKIIALPPERIIGIMEVRGVGLIRMPSVAQVPVRLAVNLVPRDEVERLPEPSFTQIMDKEIPSVALHAFDHSAVHKITLLLERLDEQSPPVIIGAL